MVKEGLITMDGTIVEVLANKMYRVKFQNGHIILTVLTGSLALKRRLKFFSGDKVKVEFSVHSAEKGRIIQKILTPEEIQKQKTEELNRKKK